MFSFSRISVEIDRHKKKKKEENEIYTHIAKMRIHRKKKIIILYKYTILD